MSAHVRRSTLLDLQTGLVDAGRRRHLAAVLLSRKRANELVMRRIPAQRARLAASAATPAARLAVHASWLHVSRLRTRRRPTRFL